MKVKFTQLFDKESGEGCAIPRTHVESAIQRPDDVHTLIVDDLELVLFAHRVMLPHRSYLLLVQTQKKDDTLVVHLAFRLYPDLDPATDILSISALEALEKLVARFGVEVTLGTDSALMFYNHKREIQAGATPLLGLASRPEDVLIQSYFKVTETEGQRFLHCALAYALDRGRYREWLEQHRG